MLYKRQNNKLINLKLKLILSFNIPACVDAELCTENSENPRFPRDKT